VSRHPVFHGPSERRAIWTTGNLAILDATGEMMGDGQLAITVDFVDFAANFAAMAVRAVGDDGMLTAL
jgi:hypothetical protein